MANMPMIFQTSTLTYEERFPVYRDQILGACRASEVTSNFAKYVELLVKKRGWKAIWSCPDEDVNMNENLNILVEVGRILLPYGQCNTPPPSPFPAMNPRPIGVNLQFLW